MSNIGKNIWDFLTRSVRFIFCDVFHLKITDDDWDKFLQFVKFGIVGLSNTVISYIVYLVALLLLQRSNLILQIDYLVAQFVGFLLSVLWSFYWNRKYVFNADAGNVPWFKALLKTYVSYAFTGIFLNSILSILWVQKLGMSKLIAPIINLVVSVPLNFVLNKFWTFRSKGEKRK